MSEGCRKVSRTTWVEKAVEERKLRELQKHRGGQSAQTLVPDGKFLSQKSQVVGKVNIAQDGRVFWKVNLKA